MTVQERIADALYDADSDGKIPVVSAVMGISEERLREIMETGDMTPIEESMLEIHLGAS